MTGFTPGARFGLQRGVCPVRDRVVVQRKATVL